MKKRQDLVYRNLDLGESSKSQSSSPQNHSPINTHNKSPQYHKPININKNLPQNHSHHQRHRASIDYVPLPTHYLERLAAEQEYINAKYPKPPKQNIIQRSYGLAKNFLTDGAKILKRAKNKFIPEQKPFGEGSTPPNAGGKSRKNKKSIKKQSNGLKIMPKPPSKPKKVKSIPR
jgi:hypothetical protein